MSDPEIDHFLFDLDGTLLDSEVLYIEAVAEAVRQKGGTLDTAQAQAIVYGRSWREVFADVDRRWPGSWQDIREMEEAVRLIFIRLEETRDIRIHGSVGLLRELALRHPVAIVSGSPREDIARGIRAMGIEQQVRFFLGTEDYFPGKPDPAGYLAAARIFAVRPERCLVFEDSHAGVHSAKAAGMHCVALKRPGAPDQDVSFADLVVPDLGGFDVGAFAEARAGRTDGRFRRAVEGSG